MAWFLCGDVSKWSAAPIILMAALLVLLAWLPILQLLPHTSNYDYTNDMIFFSTVGSYCLYFLQQTADHVLYMLKLLDSRLTMLQTIKLTCGFVLSLLCF